jgi:energy-coupling factor transporter ATP-binding protein EcfA2
MNGTAILEAQLPSVSLSDRIRKSLPDATDQQVQRFAAQVERLGQVEDYFQQFPDDRQRLNDLLERAKKALNYEKPYRIAVIGGTGAGKSTLINALLSRPLVPARAGKPATGTVLEIYLDILESAGESAQVIYRDENDIQSLVQKWVKRYSIDASRLTGSLNSGFANILQSLEPNSKPSNPREYEEFTKLRQTIAEIITQYANYSGTGRETFSLADPT